MCANESALITDMGCTQPQNEKKQKVIKKKSCIIILTEWTEVPGV